MFTRDELLRRVPAGDRAGDRSPGALTLHPAPVGGTPGGLKAGGATMGALRNTLPGETLHAEAADRDRPGRGGLARPGLSRAGPGCHRIGSRPRPSCRCGRWPLRGPTRCSSRSGRRGEARAGSGPSRRQETRAAAPEADVRAEDLAEAWVEGRVIFPADTPADEKAVVVASGPDFDHGPENRVEVPSDGSFRIAFPKGTVQGTLRVEARYLYLEELVRVDLRKRSSLYLLEPRLGGRIEGVARDDLGRPLETFEVEALSRQERSLHIAHFSRFSAEAVRRSFQGTGGRFELEGLTPGPWSIAAKAPGHVASEGRVLQVPGGLAESIELVVPRAGAHRGPRGRSDGSGCEQRSSRPRRAGHVVLPGEREDSVTTDDAGRFVLAEVVPGAVALHAESELDAPSEPLVVELEPGELVTGIELSLRRGGRITGRVVDALGTGIPGREVSLFGESTGEATSDAAGQFAFENLAAGRYYLYPVATPEEIARFAPPESQEVFSILESGCERQLEELGSADVILAPPVLLPVRIHGRVTSSGQPLANAKLRAPCPAGIHLDPCRCRGPLRARAAVPRLLQHPGGLRRGRDAVHRRGRCPRGRAFRLRHRDRYRSDLGLRRRSRWKAGRRRPRDRQARGRVRMEGQRGNDDGCGRLVPARGARGNP